MVLKSVASIFLVLLIFARAAFFLWPKKAKNWFKDMSKISRDWSYALSFILLATGLIMASLVVRLTNLETFLVSAFGFAMLVGSFLTYNEMHKDMVKIVVKKSDKWVQKVALVKLLVAAILLYILMY